MFQESGTPPNAYPVASLPWNEVWMRVLTHPSVATFEELIRDPNATSKRAYIWTFMGALIGSAISALGSMVLSTVLQSGSDAATLGVLICAPPIGALLSMLGLMISAGITQAIASALGGTGTYSKLAYAFASYVAPLSIVTGLLGWIPYCNLLSYALGAFGIVLNVMAVKAVNQFSWGKAVASSVLILMAILFVVAIVVIAVLLLLGPVIGNVFSNIVQELTLTPVP